MPYQHISVLAAETLYYANPVAHGHYIDATYGRGGMARALLQHPIASLTAFDRDNEAINDGQILAGEDTRFTIIHDVFSALQAHLSTPEHYHGIIFDLGVSSPQLDDGARGFSFMQNGPLDMRMGCSTLNAADIINTYSDTELADIFYYYGDEKRSRYIARAIVKQRSEKPFTTTGELAHFVTQILPYGKSQKHPATRIFQALRIAVNDELNEIKTALKHSDNLLRKGGRLLVISFHSLEDKIIKKFFNERAKPKALSPIEAKLGVSTPHILTYKLLTKKPITPSAAEMQQNPRARSAKLRVMEKL